LEDVKTKTILPIGRAAGQGTGLVVESVVIKGGPCSPAQRDSNQMAGFLPSVRPL